MHTINRNEFDIITFRIGNNVNEIPVGVRIIHKKSGAIAQCSTEKHRSLNEKYALEELITTQEFIDYHCR